MKGDDFMSEAVAVRPFTMLHNDLWSSKLLKVAEKEVLTTLLTFCNKNSNNTCFPSVNKIAEKLGCCARKVRYTLASLKEKFIIKVEPQYRKSDNSQTSNLFFIYDLEEVWQAESIEEIKGIVEAYEEKQRLLKIEKLKGKSEPKSEPAKTTSPAEIKPEIEIENIPNKEKEIDIIAQSRPKESNNNQSHIKSYNFSNNTSREINCQEVKGKKVKETSRVKETYSMEFLKKNFEYEALLSDYPTKYQELDSIFSIIYDVVNFYQGTVKINGNSIPTDVAVSKIMKLDIFDIQYIIEKYSNQYNKVYNHKAYVISMLYNAKEQHSLDIHNQVRYDMLHNWNYDEFHKRREQEEQEQEKQEPDYDALGKILALRDD